MASKKNTKKSNADISTTVREILNLSEEKSRKAADEIRKEVAKVKEATTKTAAATKAKAEEKKTEETKTATAATEKAPVEKKAPAKKTTARKSTAKKTASKAASAAKTTAKKAATAVKKTVAKAETAQPQVFIQYAGNSFSLDDILESAKKDYTRGRKKNYKDVKVYIKPEDGKAYYVADGDPGAVDLNAEQ